MFKNKIAGLPIENGIAYDTPHLHHKRYFTALLDEEAHIAADLQQLLNFNRTQIGTLQAMDEFLIAGLLQAPLLRERVAQLRTLAGVGEITALTWALETGEPARFPNARHAIGYCGLCAAQRASAGVQKRGPLSKQRKCILANYADRSSSSGGALQ